MLEAENGTIQRTHWDECYYKWWLICFVDPIANFEFSWTLIQKIHTDCMCHSSCHCYLQSILGKTNWKCLCHYIMNEFSQYYIQGIYPKSSRLFPWTEWLFWILLLWFYSIILFCEVLWAGLWTNFTYILKQINNIFHSEFFFFLKRNQCIWNSPFFKKLVLHFIYWFVHLCHLYTAFLLKRNPKWLTSFYSCLVCLYNIYVRKAKLRVHV